MRKKNVATHLSDIGLRSGDAYGETWFESPRVRGPRTRSRRLGSREPIDAGLPTKWPKPPASKLPPLSELLALPSASERIDDPVFARECPPPVDGSDIAEAV